MQMRPFVPAAKLLTIILTTGMMVGCPLAFAAFTVPPNDGFVTISGFTDAVRSPISPAQESAIEQVLTDYRAKTSNEIAVVFLKNLEGQSIEDAGLSIGRKWGIGAKEKNNGILILIAYEEQQMRIDVGYGLEGAVPDIVAKGIIDTDIVPFFRTGDYAGGMLAAIDALKKHIGGEYASDRYDSQAEGAPPSAFLIFVLFILFQWGLAVMGRTKSWWLGGVFGGVAGIILTVAFGWWITIPILIPIGLVLDWIVSRNFTKRGKTQWWAGGGWGPGGGFGGGGGGFGGFSGGGFGGGGASGRW